MPNHITNVLEVTTYKHEGLVNQILDAVRSEHSPFDFNTLIPRPAELDVTSGSVASNAMALTDDSAAAAMLSWPWVTEAGVIDITGLRELLRRQYAERDPKEPGCATLDDFAARLRSNVDRFGHTDWYSWSIEKWGTKWNAYSAIVGKVDDSQAIIHFESAWASPLPVLDVLAARFPQARFRLIWCDEGDDRQHRVYWEDGKREEIES